MIGVALREGADLDGFRAAVRRLAARRAPPESVSWSVADESDLFGARQDDVDAAPPVGLPRALGELIRLVVCHCDRERYALLYAAVWRVLNGERALLDVQSDPLVHRLEGMAKSVRRDLHKMHAFVRFRETHDPDGTERFVSWFEPDHFIVEATAGFFVERFRSLVWSILTPKGSLHWDRETLTVGPPAQRSDAPQSDGFEAAWRCYYENVFNPARLNPKAMRQHMPEKYWRNLPEAASIAGLVQQAPARAREMIAREAAEREKRDPLKAVAAMAEQGPQTLAELNRLIAASEPLTPGADRAVLGEGPMEPMVAFVGEQPGDQEEREGRPFIGPAGQLFDQALGEAGIDRAGVYVTNAVKHFKYEPRGKKRLHKRPNPGEVKRYRWWLQRELSFVRPKLVVAMGGTALLGLTGKPLSVLKSRGPIALDGLPGYATVHPSYLLRLQDEAAKREAYDAFRDDLIAVRRLIVETR
ncbi:UdgX family uracil-DNA binding protein [Reyranella sp.]|uniref:UdgX family uracil-DNA binding protein n=1 Tax=Reyranella sp. TaxID=1929291 RepID=UPI003C79B05C